MTFLYTFLQSLGTLRYVIWGSFHDFLVRNDTKAIDTEISHLLLNSLYVQNEESDSSSFNPGMVVHVCTPSTQVAEAGSPDIQDQPGLQGETLSQINK